MINKLASTLDLSFKVPDTEKKTAQQAIESFFSTINALSIAKDHLDILHSPLKKAQEIPAETLYEFRGKFNRFRSQVKKNFMQVKSHAFEALNKLNYFSTDTHCTELISAFKEGMDDVINAATKLLEALDDYKVDDFKDKVVIAMDNIKKESAQLENLIRDRIIDHIKQNIIGESWMTDSDEVKKLEEKIPTVIDIYQNLNKLKNEKDNLIPQNQKKPQSLNFSDSQRVFYPQDARGEGKIAT